jgi:hypothetical protein
MHPLTARTAGDGESGFILTITLLILAALVVLVGTVGISSIDASNGSSQVTMRDRAYAVAGAGLQAALYRLNETGGTTGETGTLGNGAGYSYTFSPLASPSTPCAGLWIQSSGQGVSQECITSTGTAGNQSVTVQDRVVGYTPIPSIFPVNGIFAVNGFSAGQNLSDSGVIASDGQISWGGGNINVSGQVETLAQYPISGTCSGTCTPVTLANPIAVPSSAATTPSAYAQARASNADATGITWGGLSGYWSSSSYELDTSSSGGGGTATFAPGTYYFCDVNLPNLNSVTLQASASATAANPVVIYVDSPSDSSACPSGTGNFTGGKNTLTIAGASAVAGSMEIFIFGTPGCTTTCPDVLSKNTGSYTDVQIFAPNSTFHADNNVSMTGDFVIGTVNVNNNADFTYAGSSTGTTGSGSSLSTYYPSAQQICTSASSC